MAFKYFIEGLKILVSPQNSFENRQKATFESNLTEYLNRILLMGLTAGILSFIYDICRSVFFQIFYTVDIQYLKVINYASGKALSIFFFYLFAGTFLVFIISFILNKFFKKIKYTRIFEIMFLALTPLVLFAWIPSAIIPLTLWSAFIFSSLVKLQYTLANDVKTTKKGTILERE